MKTNRGMLRMVAVALGMGTMVACGAVETPESDLKVTNGKAIPETEFPEVLMLEFKTPFGEPAICTATFIDDQTALTAAHCVDTGTVDDMGRVDTAINFVEDQNGDIDNLKHIAKSVEVYQNKRWKEDGEGVSAHDLGIVRFPPGTARAVAKLGTEQPKAGDDLVIVGYGLNELTTRENVKIGVKHMGRNKIKTVEEGFIKFQGTPKNEDASGINSASAAGDSGGPMFVDGKLVGLTSGGFVRDGIKYSLYVDLTTESSKEFLKKFVEGN